MFRSIMRRVRKWQRVSDDIARMKRLDDTLLADMGIEREQISALVRGKLRR